MRSNEFRFVLRVGGTRRLLGRDHFSAGLLGGACDEQLPHRLALAVCSVACPSGGTAPSCCIMPKVSQVTHCSATFPPAMRITLMPVVVTSLPVGEMPISVPLWVPRAVQRTVILLPSASMS